jgi:hypothetical protein
MSSYVKVQPCTDELQIRLLPNFEANDDAHLEQLSEAVCVGANDAHARCVEILFNRMDMVGKRNAEMLSRVLNAIL